MSINLIIISRYSNTDFYNQVVDYFSDVSLTGTTKIEPTDTNYETTLAGPAIDETKYNLIIYDWSSTLVGSANVNTILTNLTTIPPTPTYDVIYLGKYQDTCNKYSVNQTSVITGFGPITLVSGTEPIGFNAILLSPTFSEKIKPILTESKYYSISYAISNYSIDNTVTEFALSPNLFNYNPLYNTIDLSQSYAVKTEECQLTTSQVEPPTDNSLDIFWVIIIVLIVALLLFVLIKVFKFGIRDYESKKIQSKEL